MRLLGLVLFICCLEIPFQVSAQVDTLTWGTNYKAVAERQIVETKWKYTYAIHLESNTIIHQAKDFYEYFLHFRYDYRFEQYLNGKMSRGPWSLEGSMLFYSFKDIERFEIAEISKSKLVLEFKRPNSKGTYQYHFVKTTSEEAPFVKALNELPDVIVERANPSERRRRLAAKRKKRKKNRKRKGDPDQEYISIELIGGGYYGGMDPVLRDYIHIKSSGRLIKEFKTVGKGLTVTKKDIDRKELEDFAKFILAKDFFNMERIYDCDRLDCNKRKQKRPTPVPLRLAVAYGNKKKVITITIWGKDKHNVKYVNYPPALDNIIEAIQKMAHRLD